MQYPYHELYAKMYARYLSKPPQFFMELIDGLPKGSRVIDLCGGGGFLTQYAVDKKMIVQYVDQEERMMPKEFNNTEGIGIYTIPVDHYVSIKLATGVKEYYDLVVCRQAVNYWFKDINVKELATLIKPLGKFAFNTFVNKPSEEPTVKTYTLDGRKYVEIWQLIEGKVHHTQICQGYPTHLTEFDWIPLEEYIDKLKPYFDMNIKIEGSSAYFICTKKE